MSRFTACLIVGSIALMGVLVWAVVQPPRPANGSNEPAVTLFCAASNRAVMEEIREEYEAETGRRVSIQYGPSQTLLTQLEVAQSVDLYLPADDSFLDLAADKGLIRERLPVARMQVGLVVPKGNPAGIRSLEDSIEKGLRLVQANPDAAAVAKLTRRLLQETGSWERIHNATYAYRTTVTDVPNDLLVGAADVGIVYDAVLHTYPDLDFVKVPELSEAASEIAVAVAESAPSPTAALQFARYITAQDRGLTHYAQHGFQTKQGDPWAEKPEIAIFAGSMLRPAIEDSIIAFEKREGVRVSRTYDGCGNLVAQMKAGKQPDAYFACDVEFMNKVHDLFLESTEVSQNELVIIVQKGNPHGIQSLKDLSEPGLLVGIGNENECAMGWITQNTLREGGIQKEVMPNVTIQSPTGDMLVNQMQAGSLDAAVVYLSNATGAAEKLDAIRIFDIQCSTATQPWAVAKESKFPWLASRLFQQLCTAESREAFEAEGFRWQLGAQ